MDTIKKSGNYSGEDMLVTEKEIKRRINDPKVKAQMLKQEKEIYHKFLEFYQQFNFRQALRLTRESIRGYRYGNLCIYEMIVRRHWELNGNKLKNLYEERLTEKAVSF